MYLNMFAVNPPALYKQVVKDIFVSVDVARDLFI